MISAFAALLAAVLVSLFWERGTLIATAVTPVIVALVSEGLARPAEKVEEAAASVVARPPRARGGSEGSDGAPAGETPEAATGGAQFDGAEDEPPGDARPRRYIGIALITGLLAFAIAAVVLTVTELVTGGSLGTGGRTTLFRGSEESSNQDSGEPQPGETSESTTDEQGEPGEDEPAAPAEEQPEEAPPEEAAPEEPEEPAPAGASETSAPTAPDATP